MNDTANAAALLRRNVFVLGAGFSHSTAGLPLTQTFVESMLSEDLPDKEVIRELVSVCYPAWNDLRTPDEIHQFRRAINIEHLFNLVYTWSDLQRIVLGTADVPVQIGELGGDENRLSRLQCLAAHFIWSASLRQSPNDNLRRFAALLTPKDAVITFNWDLLVERVLDASGIPWSYIPENDSVFICKLHGSANWMERSLRHDFITDAPVRCTDKGHGISVVAEPIGAEYEPADSTERRNYRGDPRIALGFVPTILAFGFTKDISKNPYVQQWMWASQCLIRSFRIVIIGYSLPDADVAATHLLNYAIGLHRLASGLGSHRRRIIIDPSADSIGRLKRACANDCTVHEADAVEAIRAVIDVEAPERW